MYTGNLDGKLVEAGFWPGCSNCRYFQQCEERPKHAAFPHTWHWSSERIAFGENRLVLKSWVGTAAYGHSHTGCVFYQVDDSHLIPLEPKHQEYIQLQERISQVDEELDRLSERDPDSPKLMLLFDESDHLFTRQGELIGVII